MAPFTSKVVRNACVAAAFAILNAPDSPSFAQQETAPGGVDLGELVDVQQLPNGNTDRIFEDAKGTKRHFVRNQDGALVGSFIETRPPGITPPKLDDVLIGFMGDNFTRGSVSIAPMVKKGQPERGAWTTLPGGIFDGMLARAGIIPGVTTPLAMRGRTGFLEYIKSSEVLVGPTPDGQPGATRSTVGYFVKIEGTHLVSSPFSDDAGRQEPVSKEFFVLMSYDLLNTPDGPLTAFEVFVFTGSSGAGSTGESMLLNGYAVQPNGTLLTAVPLALANQRRNGQPNLAVSPGTETGGEGCLACHSHNTDDLPQGTTPFPWEGKFDAPLPVGLATTASAQPPSGNTQQSAQQSPSSLSTAQSGPANGTAPVNNGGSANTGSPNASQSQPVTGTSSAPGVGGVPAAADQTAPQAPPPVAGQAATPAGTKPNPVLTGIQTLALPGGNVRQVLHYSDGSADNLVVGTVGLHGGVNPSGRQITRVEIQDLPGGTKLQLQHWSNGTIVHAVQDPNGWISSSWSEADPSSGSDQPVEPPAVRLERIEGADLGRGNFRQSLVYSDGSTDTVIYGTVGLHGALNPSGRSLLVTESHNLPGGVVHQIQYWSNGTSVHVLLNPNGSVAYGWSEIDHRYDPDRLANLPGNVPPPGTPSNAPPPPAPPPNAPPTPDPNVVPVVGDLVPANPPAAPSTTQKSDQSAAADSDVVPVVGDLVPADPGAAPAAGAQSSTPSGNSAATTSAPPAGGSGGGAAAPGPAPATATQLPGPAFPSGITSNQFGPSQLPPAAAPAVQAAPSVDVQTTGLPTNPLSTAYSGPSSQELNGGGHEIVTLVDGHRVHDIYGPPGPNGQSTLLTTYTEMSTAGLSLNSAGAAATNAVNGGTTVTHELPNGGLEVIHPSEFVPGTNNHIIYGPPNRAGGRSIITSFLQPQSLPTFGTTPLGPAQPMTLDTEKQGSTQPQTVVPYGGMPLGPAQTMTLDTEKGGSVIQSSPNPNSGAAPTNANVPGGATGISNGIFNPSRVSTVPGGTPGGAVIDPARGALLEQSTPNSAGSSGGTASAIRNELLQQTKTGLASPGVSTTPAGVVGTTKQQLLQEMQQTLAPSVGTTTNSGGTSGSPQQPIQEMRLPAGTNSTSLQPTTGTKSTGAKSFENVVTPHSNAVSNSHLTTQVVHPNTVINPAPFVQQHAPIYAPPPPPPPKKKP